MAASSALPLLRAPVRRGPRAAGSDGGGGRRAKGSPGVDTRIHWSSPDEGWLGAKPRAPEPAAPKQKQPDRLFADQGADSADVSHYDFLGVAAEADAEEIKAAYRRLSKEYHPDTTELPLAAASVKFIRLREAYKVLGDEDRRRFYDWTLAQEAASRRMRARLEDPRKQDVRNWESVPDTVDRLAGKNMPLSDQALTALTIDVAIILFAFACVAYVVLFKEQY
ncbi:chaperone DnaJ-domain superfamily protein [Wolffia australiana]